jgi:hypothetical protein
MPRPRIPKSLTEHDHNECTAQKTEPSAIRDRNDQWHRFAVQRWLHGLPARLQCIWTYCEPLPFDPAAHDPDVCNDCNMAMHVMNTAGSLRTQLTMIADYGPT